MGGNKQQKTTETSSNTSTNTPAAWQQNQIENLYKLGNQALGQMPQGPNATQTQAMDWLKAQAPSMNAGADAIRALGTATANGDFLNPQSNPHLAGAVAAAQRPLQDQLSQRVLSIGDAAQQAGAYGGDRAALLNSTALKDFNTAALDAANGIYYQNYANERALQQNAPALLSAANQLNLAPGQLLGTLGDQQMSWDQNLPWAGLDKMAALLSLGSGYGTQTSNGTATQVAPRGSTAGGIFSGALGGASAGSAFGPWGAGIGGVVGGLGSLFG